MANIIIHNQADINDIYEFDNVGELAFFLHREMDSVQNSLYKIDKGIRKSKLIRDYDGIPYIVDHMTYESVFRYKKNNIIYNVNVLGEEEGFSFNNFKTLKSCLELFRNKVSMEPSGQIIIELEMKNTYE